MKKRLYMTFQIRIVLFLLVNLILTTVCSYGQSNNRFLVDSAEWRMVDILDEPFTNPEYYFHSFFANRDSTINGINYRIIDFDSLNNPVMAVREDSAGRIFCRSLDFIYSHPFFCDSSERIVYDFNLNLNDTFQIIDCNQNDTIRLHVMNVDSVMTLQGNRKQIYFDYLMFSSEIGNNCGDTLKWVDGIGGAFSPFFFNSSGTGSGSTCVYKSNVCEYRINNFLVYSFDHPYFPTCSDLLEVSSGNIQPQSVFMNTRPDFLSITNKNNCEINLEILDCFGRKIKHFNIPKNIIDYEADLQYLNPGIYYCLAYSNNSLLNYSKIVISK